MKLYKTKTGRTNVMKYKGGGPVLHFQIAKEFSKEEKYGPQDNMDDISLPYWKTYIP